MDKKLKPTGGDKRVQTTEDQKDSKTERGNTGGQKRNRRTRGKGEDEET